VSFAPSERTVLAVLWNIAEVLTPIRDLTWSKQDWKEGVLAKVRPWVVAHSLRVSSGSC
jgi:hypothetical protein